MHDAESITMLENSLRDACAVVVHVVQLIPEDLPDARSHACAVIIEQMMIEINALLGGTLGGGGPVSELPH